MLLATIIEKNHKLRAQVERQKRQLKTMHYPQIYLLNMAIWIAAGVLLGYIFWGGK